MYITVIQNRRVFGQPVCMCGHIVTSTGVVVHSSAKDTKTLYSTVMYLEMLWGFNESQMSCPST